MCRVDALATTAGRTRDKCLIGLMADYVQYRAVQRTGRMFQPGPGTKPQRLFYLVFLPLGAAANLVLGLIVLAGLKPDSEFSWLQLGTGALCCMIAGWLACSTWSKSYWSRSMARQVAVWRTIADAFFGWVEDAALPADALRSLKTSLDKVVPDSAQQ